MSAVREEREQELCGLTGSSILARIFAPQQLFPEWVQHDVQKGDVGGLRMEVWPKKHLGRGAGRGRMNRYHLEISARQEERQVRVQNGGRIDFGGLGM